MKRTLHSVVITCLLFISEISIAQFNITNTNNCDDFSITFDITDSGNITSVTWNFDDPASGTNSANTIIATHTFFNSGTYNVSATITDTGGVTQTIQKEIEVIPPPIANTLPDIRACEDIPGSRIASGFDTSAVAATVLGNQTDKTIIYFDGNNNQLAALPNPMTNTVPIEETITVRVANTSNLSCYVETTFRLIVDIAPDATITNPIIVCDDNTDGIADFDANAIESAAIGDQAGLTINYFEEDGTPITTPLPDPFRSSSQTITARLTNNNNCSTDTTIQLVVSPQPTANAVPEQYACDDNGDGISEVFDTTGIQDAILGGQTNVNIEYEDIFGNIYDNNLPNPLTNVNPFVYELTATVTASGNNCPAQVIITFITAEEPQITDLDPIFACDEGNGFSTFDTSQVEAELLNDVVGNVNITYTDGNGNQFGSPFPSNYRNAIPFSETISVRVENATNPICFSETEIVLNVEEIPTINLEDSYTLCEDVPSLTLESNPFFSSWQWIDENDQEISNQITATITDEGTYTLIVTEDNDDISCENSFSFQVNRAQPPVIEEIRINDLSDSNAVEIIVSGSGEYLYSLDGTIFQDSNVFVDVPGGTYNVIVREANGCGEAQQEVSVIGYPKFFSPNGDMFNPVWKIEGGELFPDALIYIFDRHGKLLKQIAADGDGWNGTFNGKLMPSAQYWFTVDLRNGRDFKGSFALIR